MKLGDLFGKTGKLITDNSPVILTAIGVTGTVTTAILAGKASFKAAQVIQDEYDNRIGEAGGINGEWESPTPKEKFELTWQLYVPAAGTAILTIAAIIFANRIGTRRAAGLAAAFSLSEKAFGDYREKITEVLGEKKEQAARDAIAQKHLDENPIGDRQVIIANGGNVLCYEDFTDRYFMSDIETLKKAQNDINYRVINSYSATLTDFYDLIGLNRTANSDYVGWNTDKLLELSFSPGMSKDNRPCIVMTYFTVPVNGYHHLH